MFEYFTKIFVHRKLKDARNYPINFETERKTTWYIEVIKNGEDGTTVAFRSEGTSGYNPQTVKLFEGDTLALSHTFHVDLEQMRFDGLFPLKIDYRDARYTLQETKNGKLILTK